MDSWGGGNVGLTLWAGGCATIGRCWRQEGRVQFNEKLLGSGVGEKDDFAFCVSAAMPPSNRPAVPGRKPQAASWRTRHTLQITESRLQVAPQPTTNVRSMYSVGRYQKYPPPCLLSYYGFIIGYSLLEQPTP